MQAQLQHKGLGTKGKLTVSLKKTFILIWGGGIMWGFWGTFCTPEKSDTTSQVLISLLADLAR